MRALGFMVPPALYLIQHIIFSRSSSQMGRANAWPIIAAMNDEEPFRDRALGEFVGDSVRPGISAFNADAPITIRGTATSPRPASFRRTINLAPKELLVWCHYDPQQTPVTTSLFDADA